MKNARTHLVLGGTHSGKSRRAEEVAATSGLPVCYVATYVADPSDDEMARRIREHQQRRPASWRTVDGHFDLKNLLHETAGELLLIDSLTLWLSYLQSQNRPDDDILAELDAALEAASEEARALVIVGDEIGMGLVPIGSGTRAFRDLCGRANQLVAGRAAVVEFMLAGLPLVLKGGGR